MSDVIGHLCGICGDNHPSLLNISPILVGVAGYFSYIKLTLKTKIKLWKHKNRT